MICRLFTQKSIHGTNSLCNSRTAVQGDSPASAVPQYSRARPKKGWMAGRKLFFTRTSLRSYSHEGRDQAGTHFVFQRQVGGQMSVWKRSLASPRLHSAVGSSPNYDASTGCSASLCTPLHCLVCAGRRAGRAAGAVRTTE